MRATIPTVRLTSIRERLAFRPQIRGRSVTDRLPMSSAPAGAPAVWSRLTATRPDLFLAPASARAILPRLDPSKVSDGVHNPPLRATGKPAELADGLALARYAALRRRFAPATTRIASGPPLAGHGWHGDSARYVPRQSITPLTGIAAQPPPHRSPNRPSVVASVAATGSQSGPAGNANDWRSTGATRAT